MIKIHSQKGSAHAVVIIILVAALVMALGFVFWQNFILKSNTPTVSTEITNSATPDPNKGYVVVKDWGVRFKTSVSDKLEYKPYSQTGGYISDSSYEGLGLTIKASVLTDQNCVKFGIDLYRQTQSTSNFTTKKIGNYYYFVTGGPGECSTNTADLVIQKTILNDLKIDNLEAL
jgi:hypothetical protein